MAQAAGLSVGDDHPLALELASLRAAVARYQHEAHATSVKLQRHSLETSHALERAYALEGENVALKDEVIALRASPDICPHPASLQVPELTLALRRLSDKLTLTEETLLARTHELATARTDLLKAESETESAYKREAITRSQLEEGREKEFLLTRVVRATEEEKKLVDLVVQEYADLVRTLEGRPRASTSSTSSLAMTNGTNDSSVTLVDSLAEGKSGLKKLFEEFNEETGRLESELSRLRGENAVLESKLDVERERAEHDRGRLADALTELEKYRMDDNTAAKMVSRYMKFSQSSTDSLQHAMESLKTRHAATTATLSTEIAHLQKHFMSEQRQCEKLRQALDELSEDISREAYGRRREISLRLAFLGREESLAEGLRRWIRKARETFDRAASTDAPQTPTREVFARMTQDAESLLETLNGQPLFEEGSPGSVARVIAAQDAVSMLTRELQTETDRRMELERRLAQSYVDLEAHTIAEDLHNASSSHNPSQQNGDSRQLLSIEERDPAQLEDTTASSSTTHSNAPDTHDPVTSVAESIPSPLQVSVSVDPPAENAGQEYSDKPPDGPLPIPESPSPRILVSPPDTPAAVEVAPSTSLLFSQTVSGTCVGPVETPDGVTLGVEASPLPEPIVHKGPSSTAIVKQDDIASTDVALQPFPQLPDTSDADIVPSNLPATDPVDLLSAPSPEVSNGDASHQTPAEEPDVFAPGASGSGKGQKISPLTSKLIQDLPHPSSLPQEDLLADLARAKHRYDDLQHAFRDCHLALKELRKDVSALPDSSQMTLVVQKVVERLNDYNEDTRVELEIRITDEERIAQGYETLLTVPGAMSDEVDETEVRSEMMAFVDGSGATVTRATQQFSRKLDDLQHDIACIKRTLYELSSAEEDAVPTSTTPTKSPAWSSWTVGLLSPSRPISPAPTFGSVMTSPRLHKVSLSSQVPKPSDDSSSTASNDPFASLGLRIPMPAHILSPPPRATPRARTISAMYMLGLGSRSSSFGLGTVPPKAAPTSPLASDSRDMTAKSVDLNSDIE
ncbi:hypothetical protein SCP_0402010 [Sparassis crispa]|uniref:Uncharacterized protein n=1 Tax=Sparassis crispa TaxID=139825 RepID=A0A401GI47_9APHY|nr:hypothetical protein SCP_0402010 [Sparassis crispa]GBE81828.1 hypothetical protein SCP_0402010 [Sparassis crispa]